MRRTEQSIVGNNSSLNFIDQVGHNRSSINQSSSYLNLNGTYLTAVKTDKLSTLVGVQHIENLIKFQDQD